MQPNPPQPDQKVLMQMTITLLANGSFQLRGIPDNEFVAKGFIVKIQEAVMEHFRNRQQVPLVEVPRLTVREN